MRFIRRNIYKLTIILIVLLISIFCVIKVNLKSNKVIASTIEKEDTIKLEKKEEIAEVIKEEKIYYVDIKGEINNPGVYGLKENSRIIDAINMAGGLTVNANTSNINLAKKIFDEMVIIIYSNEEIENNINKSISNSNIKTNYDCLDLFNDACINNIKEEKKKINNNINDIDNENETVNEVNSLININTAEKEELMSLPSIGEAKALAIIEYRNNNGNFNSIEDILNVSGIGNALYEKIKDLITT